MAVVAVGCVVMQKLTDMVNEESIMGQELIVHWLERIRGALVERKSYFIDAEEKQGNDSIKNWADECLKSVYDVEDTIETFAFHNSSPCAWRGFSVPLKNIMACKVPLNGKMKKKILKCIKLLENKEPKEVTDASLRPLRVTNRREVDLRGKAIAEEEEEGNGVSAAESGDENDAFVEDYEVVREKQNSEGSSRGKWRKRNAVIRERLLLPSRLMSISSYDADKMGMVGFKNYLSDLAAELKKESPRFVSVLGEMGSGKTTLAQAVLVSEGVRDHFRPFCVQLSVSPDSTPEKIFLKLLNQVESSKDQGGVVTLDWLKARLSAHLNKDKKGYLIVLDNVSKDTWDALRDAFREIGHGGKIIITTCHEEVAKDADTIVVLEGLNEDESSELLVQKAAVKELPEELKKEILDRCNGLPLNIVLLGSLLSMKKKHDYEELSSVLRQQQKLSTMEILAFCYNDLPRDLQLCMLYMVVFPRDYDIPVRRLLRLWLAEGFIKRPAEGFVEDVAQRYFDDLLQRSLIQVSKEKSDGNDMKKCRLLGTLHDFLSSKVSGISLFHVAGTRETKFGARRLVDHVHSEDSLKGISRPEYIRSYLSFNFRKKDIPAVEVGNHLKKMIRKRVSLLRVLDLEGVYKPSLPENLGDFFHLRYLGLRWTFLDVLPLSVGELTHLETLDIKHTYVNSLPSSLWKLKCLRHLNLNETRVEKPLAHPLPQLLTLWGLSIVKSECLVSVKDELKDLRELGITFNLADSDSLLDWISSLTSLQQLRLRSKDDAGRPSKLVLKSFSRLEKLSNMNLLGHLHPLPKIDAFPKNVQVLSLSVSLLRDDPMPTLGQLPKLTVLRLLANSYLGEKLECPKGGFPELLVLKLWMLRNLKEWVLEKGAMEKLEELNVRCCPRLESIPAALLSQRDFNQLTVSNMPEPFLKYAEKNKSTHFSLIVKNYDFTPLPWEDGDDSFNGMFPSAANANGF